MSTATNETAPEVGPRCPAGEQEAFAWGFLIGYLGHVPRVMHDAFEAVMLDDDISPLAWTEMTPTFLDDYPDDAYAFRRGYDSGCATVMDHLHPEDREG